MSGFKVAKQFFEACEAGEGWVLPKFVADDAVFAAQSEPIVDIKSVKDYAEWMKKMGGVLKSNYAHSSARMNKRCAFFLLLFTRPTLGRAVRCSLTSRPTPIMFMRYDSQNDAVTSMTKIWSAGR